MKSFQVEKGEGYPVIKIGASQKAVFHENELQGLLCVKEQLDSACSAFGVDRDEVRCLYHELELRDFDVASRSRTSAHARFLVIRSVARCFNCKPSHRLSKTDERPHRHLYIYYTLY